MAEQGTQLGQYIPTDNGVIWWMDWFGENAELALRAMGSGEVDSIVWGVTNSEAFEKAKRFSTGRVLCVTGKHPHKGETERTEAEWHEKDCGVAGGFPHSSEDCEKADG